MGVEIQSNRIICDRRHLLLSLSVKASVLQEHPPSGEKNVRLTEPSSNGGSNDNGGGVSEIQWGKKVNAGNVTDSVSPRANFKRTEDIRSLGSRTGDFLRRESPVSLYITTDLINLPSVMPAPL